MNMNSRFLLPAASQARRAVGFTLLEVILALSVFSIAAIALVGTMNQIALVSADSQRLLEVEQGLESLIDEYGKMPQIREFEEQLKPGPDGVAYHVKIDLVRNLQNQDGRFLQNTFRIQATARWDDGAGPVEISAETYRYAGAFLPVN